MAKRKQQEKTSWLAKLRAKGNWPIYFLLTLFILQVFGLVALFSASHVMSYIETGNSYRYLTNQMVFVAIGMVGLFVVSSIDYHILFGISRKLYPLCVVLLLIVLFACDPLNGARRWLYWDKPILRNIPAFQVSEIVKFEMIILTATLICSFSKKSRNGYQGVVFPILATVPVAGLVYAQPHLSGTILIVGVVLVMIMVSGIGFRYMLIALSLGVACSPGLLWIALKIPYVKDRLAGWTFDVTKMKWQTMQSVYAIGSGGLKGLGLGNGIQKQMWLPEATNDFIFSVVCEELGFIGAMFVIFLFVGLVAQGVVIALEAADLFGTLIAVGISAQIGLQFAFNLGVVTSLLPNTGISLPFFSSGGTSLIMLLCEIGVLVSVARIGSAEKERIKNEERQKTATKFVALSTE